MATGKPTTTTKTAAARKPAAPRRLRKAKVTHDQIAERAYYIALDSGTPELDSWLQAERELVGA